MATTTTALTIRDAAAQLGVTVRTLKYYEELGMVVPVRSEGGYRLYEAAHLEILARALRLRSLGFSLNAIATMLQQSFETTQSGGSRLSEDSLKVLRDSLISQLDGISARVAQVRKELKEAASLQAQLKRDLDYVERRLAGESVETALAKRRSAATKSKP